MRTSFIPFLALAISVLLVGAAQGQDLGNLAGTIDVSKVESKVDGVVQDTIRQLYTLNYWRALTDYVEFRAGLRYYDLDLELADAIGGFREEIQPSAELSWNHPWFTFSASGVRQTARSPAISGKLVNDSFLLDWNSAWTDTPTFNLRYRYRHITEDGDQGDQDTQAEGLEANVTWDLENESFEYRIARDWGMNNVRGLGNVQYSQRFNYSGLYRPGSGNDVRLSTHYRYTRNDLTTDVQTGARFLEKVDPLQGLGGVDSTPDQDPLPIVPGLIDGNTQTPVEPPIGIGAGQFDRNVGVDLGVQRTALGALFVYVDRLSDSSVAWTVWTSDDNLNWAGPVSTVTTFNASLRRYEVEFTELTGRYIKVVNGGINQIPDVQVTEVEAYETRTETGTVEQDRSSHLADARVDWFINPKWSTSLDLVARLQPPSGSISKRLEFDYTGRVVYEPSRTSTHLFSAGQAWREFEGDRQDTRGDFANYSYLYDPLPTLGTSLSGSFRQDTDNGVLSMRSLSALAGANATPWPAIVTSADFGVSRIDQPVADLLTDSWTVRVSLETEITRSLRVSITGRHKESYAGPDRELRVRRTLIFGGDLRVTSTIFGRATVSLNDDEVFSRNEDYLASWRLFSRLALTGQYNSDSTSSGFRSDRWAATANLDLFQRLLMFRNVIVYTQYSEIDQSIEINSHILSWSYGMRASF